MKKLLILLSLLTAILALTAAITKFYNMTVILVLIAFFSGITLIFRSKTKEDQPKSIKYIFLTLIIALSLTICKNIFIIENSRTMEKIESVKSEISNKAKTFNN